MKYLVLIILLLFAPNTFYSLHAQEGATNNDCEKLLTTEYISDGQDYTINMNNDKDCELHVTFYGKTDYRIVICSKEQENLWMTIHNNNNKQIFKKNIHTPTYTDLSFNSTMECIIKFTQKSKINQVLSINLLIGFKIKE